ncbi:MAG TPA: hypothetical protein VFD58_28915 [Blastocatellia bacterium]|nr:hypothetical protein [Blastocatellia bacterium]
MPINHDDKRGFARIVTADFAERANSHLSDYDAYATGKLIPQCIQCNAPIEGTICGCQTPCPSCGFPCPLGDSSEPAEK